VNNDTETTPSMGFDEPPPEPETIVPPAPEQDGLGYKPDDDKIVLRLVPSLKGKLAFFHSQWKMYERGCWHGRDVYETRRYVRNELRELRDGSAESGIKVNQGRIKALASMLEDDLFIPDRQVLEQQKEQARYINLRNGLFNLDTMTLEPHRADLYFTTQLDFDYDPDAEAPTFRKYLNSSLVHPNGKTDFELVQLAEEALAYSMTARTDLKASFWLVGQKDSGKSTFIAMIKALMGDLHTTIDLTQLGINRFLLAGIVGKRVLTFTEASSNTMLPDALYKALTGGSDEIYADVKNRDPICFRPEAKVWWAMNEMPRMSDRSGATARRIVIIPFNRTIPEHERIPNLEQLLISERSGIFAWLVNYLWRLKRAEGFDHCEQSDQLLQEYIMENDTEATFVEECCDRHESYKVQSSALYDRYATWCITNGFKPKNSNQIAKEWRRLGFEKGRANGSWWHGLQLRTIRS
jgi:putative DNA primase/helicase